MAKPPKGVGPLLVQKRTWFDKAKRLLRRMNISGIVFRAFGVITAIAYIVLTILTFLNYDVLYYYLIFSPALGGLIAYGWFGGDEELAALLRYMKDRNIKF